MGRGCIFKRGRKVVLLEKGCGVGKEEYALLFLGGLEVAAWLSTNFTSIPGHEGRHCQRYFVSLLMMMTCVVKHARKPPRLSRDTCRSAGDDEGQVKRTEENECHVV